MSCYQARFQRTGFPQGFGQRNGLHGAGLCKCSQFIFDLALDGPGGAVGWHREPLDNLRGPDGAVGVKIQQIVQAAHESRRFAEFFGEPGGLDFETGEINGGHLRNAEGRM